MEVEICQHLYINLKEICSLYEFIYNAVVVFVIAQCSLIQWFISNIVFPEGITISGLGEQGNPWSDPQKSPRAYKNEVLYTLNNTTTFFLPSNAVTQMYMVTVQIVVV